jgi:hypothetical protein
MIIYYPTYYLVPVVPVVSLDEGEYNFRNNYDYNIQYNNEYGFRCNLEENQVYDKHMHVKKDIFEEIDEEYVNESTK